MAPTGCQRRRIQALSITFSPEFQDGTFSREMATSAGTNVQHQVTISRRTLSTRVLVGHPIGKNAANFGGLWGEKRAFVA